MNKDLAKFMAEDFKSKASIIDDNHIQVIAPNTEEFWIVSSIGCYTNEETRKYFLHVAEYLFDTHFSEDTEKMVAKIMQESTLRALGYMGIGLVDRHKERIRIGNRIRQIRTMKKIDARELAKMVGIDAANLSRIENGKHSVGLDVLEKIANTLGYKIDLVEL